MRYNRGNFRLFIHVFFLVKHILLHNNMVRSCRISLRIKLHSSKNYFLNGNNMANIVCNKIEFFYKLK